MKQLFFITALLMAFAFTVDAQWLDRQTTQIDGDETVNLASYDNPYFIQITATNVGGTTNEVVTIQCSADDSVWTVPHFKNQWLGIATPIAIMDTATLGIATMTTGTTATWVFDTTNDKYRYKRVSINGEASDTTAYVVKAKRKPYSLRVKD